MEREDGSGLTIHSEAKTTASERRHWTEIARARDQKKDQEEVGEESKRKTWKEVEGHRQRPRSWSQIQRSEKSLLVASAPG